MRSSFIRNFYLPYHLPSLSNNYHSHFHSRIPCFNDEIEYCYCSRTLNDLEEICFVCRKSVILIEDARNGKLSDEIVEVLKPLKCSDCLLRFGDNVSLESHIKQEHKSNHGDLNQVIPINLNVNQLREELRLRNLSTSGNKDILRRRLEGAVSI